MKTNNIDFFDAAREDSAVNQKESFSESDMHLNIRAGACAEYEAGSPMNLVRFGHFTFLGAYKVTTSSGEQPEVLKKLHIFCLIYKLSRISNCEESFSAGSDQNNASRQTELT